jgi:transcriptional regulator with XRE-family HTH domain
MPRWSKSDRSPLGNLRAEAGFSRETVASTLNLSLSTMVRYETGSSDIPIGIAEDLAVLYKVPFDTLREAIKETKMEKGIPITGKRLKEVIS